jgi:hypothetical protein
MSGNDLSKRMADSALAIRRNQQAEVLVSWGRGEFTGRECIEQIVGLETMIYLHQPTLRKSQESSDGPKTDPSQN